MTSPLMVVALTVLLQIAAPPKASAAEVLKCSIRRHMHDHALTVHLEGNQVVSFDYTANVTQLPAGNDFCMISGDRTDRELLWTPKGRETVITLTSEGALKPEETYEEDRTWLVTIIRERDQWTFEFDGRGLCGPSAVHATQIAIRRGSKRCVLINVAE